MASCTCEQLLLTSLTQFYNDNPVYKELLKDIVDGRHKLSLRVIDWLVTHYSKSYNIYYWINKKTKHIYEVYPLDDNIIGHTEPMEPMEPTEPTEPTEPIKDIDDKDIKKINLYLDYRAQLKSYAKINFDSFRRHNRITFFFDTTTNDYIETTIGQLNFFRWAFNNNIIEYATRNYEKIYQHMVENNSYKKQKKTKQSSHTNIQEITKTLCTLRFD